MTHEEYQNLCSENWSYVNECIVSIKEFGLNNGRRNFNINLLQKKKIGKSGEDVTLNKLFNLMLTPMKQIVPSALIFFSTRRLNTTEQYEDEKKENEKTNLWFLKTNNEQIVGNCFS